MNLPFSPTFFRKIDVYQQLQEYETQSIDKRLWKGEKTVLLWARGSGHQNLGSTISESAVGRALEEAFKAGYINEDEKKSLNTDKLDILGCLVTHGYGVNAIDSSLEPIKYIRLNRDAVLAGQVLKETDDLQNLWRYKFWVCIWWLLFIAATLLLISQAWHAVLEFKNPNVSKPSYTSEIAPVNQTFSPQSSNASSPTPSPREVKPTPETTKLTPTPTPLPISKPHNKYICNCKKTCKNLSCEEAQYQLNACGCSARDADDDGIACDAQCQ